MHKRYFQIFNVEITTISKIKPKGDKFMDGLTLCKKAKKWIAENEDGIKQFIKNIVKSGDCLKHIIYLDCKGEIYLGDLQGISSWSHFADGSNIIELLMIDELNYLHERYKDELEYTIEDIKSRDSKAEIDMEEFDSYFWNDVTDNYFKSMTENLEAWEKDLKHLKYLKEHNYD